MARLIERSLLSLTAVSAVTYALDPMLSTRKRVPPLIDVLTLDDDSDLVDALEERMQAAISLHSFDYARLDLAARVCFIAWGLDAEVNNGGFHQYFSNYTGDGAADAPLLLRRIGESKTARLVEQASRLFPRGVVPRSHTERRELLERITEKQLYQLERLGRSFFLGNWRLNIRPFLRRNTDELLEDEARSYRIAQGT
jgi:hypothetical protein